MASANSTDVSLASLQNDISALKRDVTSLLGHLQRDAGKTVSNAVAQLDDSAQGAYRALASSGSRSLDQVGRQVDAQPVLALLLALGVGYLGGRLLSR